MCERRWRDDDRTRIDYHRVRNDDHDAADWAVEFGETPGPPAYADGRVFVGTDAGVLYAIDASRGELA